MTQGRAGPRVVALGGGHGLAAALRALRLLDLVPTAVVTVADNGGSSGRLRDDLGIIAPGDLRMALLALARNTELADALAHRFAKGELEGHAMGNLLLVALAERENDFVAALRQAALLLDCQGDVLPSTVTPVTLHAEAMGQHLDGQVRVQGANGQIERVWLEPEDPAGCKEAVMAIEEADWVVLGPGSLFTSVIANLLVPTVQQAVTDASARLLHIANVRTQPGETTGMSLNDHLAVVLQHLSGRTIDVTVLHDGPLGADSVGHALGSETTLSGLGHIVKADLVERNRNGQPRESHDPVRLAPVLERVVVVEKPSRSA